MSDNYAVDTIVPDLLSTDSRTVKRPTLQLALKQQAKRRRRNTSIASQGNGIPLILSILYFQLDLGINIS